MDILHTNAVTLPLTQLTSNEGQIVINGERIAANPRYITDDEYAALKESIKADNLTGLNPLKVYEYKGQYVVIGGNMRLRAMRELGIEGTSCIIIPQDATAEVLRKEIITDNATFGKWDYDALANEWDEQELRDWGVDLPASEIEEEEEEKPQKDEQVEELLNAAMKQYVGEFRKQLDDALTHGWLFQGMCKGYAKIKFLRSKYYGENYDRKNAVVFTPEIFQTPSGRSGVSYYEQLRRSATNTNNTGITGFRTAVNDGMLNKLMGMAYPISAGRSCLDFPVCVARELYEQHAKGGKVLDPCAGWGGRQIGALLAGVAEYVGIDPSPISLRAANDIYDTFGQYQDTKCRFIGKPYEKTTNEEVGTEFDFALTSPPYFDVEDYAGGEQAHKQYAEFDLWVDKFYEPLIVLTMGRLKDTGAFALQVGSQSYPLRDKAQDICKKYGYKCEIVQTKILDAEALNGTDEERSECIILITK